jgi:organic hydroperoxide reductase OsmC/OhrA
MGSANEILQWDSYHGALLESLNFKLVFLQHSMTPYTAQTLWLRNEQNFLDNRYSRKHVLRFDGGAEVAGSSSPHVVPLPFSDATAVDPEEMLVASLSSCHMLWFLSIAAERKFCVDRYSDAASGIMEKNTDGKLVMSVVTLRPDVAFSGERMPTSADVDAMHDAAHADCFIANSVKTKVQCEPVHSALG